MATYGTRQEDVYEKIMRDWGLHQPNPLARLPVAVSRELPAGFIEKYRNRIVAAARFWDAGDGREPWDGSEELFGLRLGDRGGVGACVTLTRRVLVREGARGGAGRLVEVQAAGPADVLVAGEFAGW